MSQLFDLNVDNYSLHELLDFFGLTQNDDAASVDRTCRALKLKIQGDPKLGPVTKGKINDFLNKAVNRLSQSRNAVKQVKSNSVGASTAGMASGSGEFMRPYGDSYLIKRPAATDDAPALVAQMGAPPGIVNPIAISTIKRALNVDTRFRGNYYATKSTDFVFNIPYKFENVTCMTLATYELPLTFYAISKQYDNNCILFQWDADASGNYTKQYTLLIPDGNYTTAFQSGGGAAAIETTINGILAGTALVALTGLAFSVDKTSGRSIFACNSATDASGNVYPGGGGYLGAMRIVFNVNATAASAAGNSSSQNDTRPLPYFLGWQLGFRTAAYEMSGSGGTPAAVSEGICLITGPKYVFLCIDDYNNNVNNYYASTFGSSTIAPNIIARLNLKSHESYSAGSFGVVGGESLTSSLTYNRTYFGPVDIQRIRITLVDEFGRVLDLNNMDWSFALMFECVYSSSSA